MAHRRVSTPSSARLGAPSGLVLSAAMILLASSPALADPAAADSMAVAVESSVPAPEPFRVRVEGVEETHAAFVGSWWNGYVRVMDGWGHVEFVHATRVIAILDSTGQDVTVRVLDHRAQLGMQPPFVAPPRVLKIKAYKSPLRANIAQGSFFKRSGNPDDKPDEGYLVQVDVGKLWRIGERHGLGVALFSSGHGETTNLGLKAWGRRLIRRDLVIDLAPGVVLASDDDYASRSFAPAFVCETALTYNSWFSVAGQVEARDRTYSWGPETGERREWSGYFGVKFGGYAAAPAIVVSAGALLFMHDIESNT
jgi:hypothetical protein